MEPCKWPNFFIVGAVKCGTTTLYAMLKRHPQVFLPAMKEPHYFMDPLPVGMVTKLERVAGDREGYRRLYQGAEGFQAVGDASPYYLWDANAAARIHETCPDARIIIILRDPVVRAHSQFLMDPLSGLYSKCTFFELLQRDVQQKTHQWGAPGLYVELGLYHEQVRRYIELFGRDRVLVLLFDNLMKDPRSLYTSIAKYLEVDAAPFENMELVEAQNTFRSPRFQLLYQFASMKMGRDLRQKLLPTFVQDWLRYSPLLYSRQKPPLDDDARQFLQEIYQPNIAKLEDLLGRQLPELRKSWKPAGVFPAA